MVQLYLWKRQRLWANRNVWLTYALICNWRFEAQNIKCDLSVTYDTNNDAGISFILETRLWPWLIVTIVSASMDCHEYSEYNTIRKHMYVCNIAYAACIDNKCPITTVTTNYLFICICSLFRGVAHICILSSGIVRMVLQRVTMQLKCRCENHAAVRNNL